MAGVKGRSGRPRLSAPEHALRGNYRADRHGPLELAEPQAEPVRTAIEPPPDLSTKARPYWRYFAPLLASARALTPADIHTLADYCRTCVNVADRSRRLDRELRRRHMDPVERGRLDRELRGWMERKLKLAETLGLTPLARTRLNWTGHHQTPTADTPQPAKSKLAELQERAAELRRPVGVR